MTSRMPLTLQTRVGRQLALMFVLTAMLPAGVLAVDGYRRTRDALLTQSEAQLAQTAKNVGMELLAQLERAHEMLAEIGEDFDAGSVTGRRGAPEVFSSLVVTDGATVRALRGAEPPASFFGAGRTPEPAQNSLLRVEPSARAVWLGVDASQGRRLWGAVAWDYLFPEVLNRPSVGGFDVDVCVRAVGIPAPLTCAPVDSATPTLSGRWSLFLEYRFKASPWRIDVTAATASVMAPIAGFRRTLLLSILTVFGLVTLLTSLQVRRSLEPLEALKAGTHRIAARDFASRVEVSSRDEFRDLAVSFNDMAGEIDHQFRTLSAIGSIDRAALGSVNRAEIARTAVDGLHAVVDGASAAVLIAGDREADPWHRVGGTAVPDDTVDVMPEASDLQRLYEARDRWIVRNGHGFSWIGEPSGADATTTAIVPLVSHRELVGALVVAWPDEPLAEHLAVARRLADQLALGVSNARLIGRLNALSYGALSALARTVDANSPWTAGHSERVTSLSLAIGRRAGLSAADLRTLHRGGLLHDIGKIGLPTGVLDRPGALTPDELAMVRRHPEIGAKILAPMPAFDDIIPIVLHHHERVDGAGYPAGLAGSSIPVLARLLAVADVYDALVSDRPYRGNWGSERAVETIRSERGAHLDADFVDVFLDVMRSDGDAARFAWTTRDLSLTTA